MLPLSSRKHEDSSMLPTLVRRPFNATSSVEQLSSPWSMPSSLNQVLTSLPPVSPDPTPFRYQGAEAILWEDSEEHTYGLEATRGFRWSQTSSAPQVLSRLRTDDLSPAHTTAASDYARQNIEEHTTHALLLLFASTYTSTSISSDTPANSIFGNSTGPSRIPSFLYPHSQTTGATCPSLSPPSPNSAGIPMRGTRGP